MGGYYSVECAGVPTILTGSVSGILQSMRASAGNSLAHDRSREAEAGAHNLMFGEVLTFCVILWSPFEPALLSPRPRCLQQ